MYSNKFPMKNVGDLLFLCRLTLITLKQYTDCKEQQQQQQNKQTNKNYDELGFIEK